MPVLKIYKLRTFLLILILNLFLFAFNSNFVFAQFAGGNGSKFSPYQIENCDQLQEIKDYSYDNFILNSNIECSATSTWNEDPGNPGTYFGFDPIDNFEGHLDGNNLSINNLYINRPTEEEVALFSYISNGGSISDLNLSNINITGLNMVGALVGGFQDDVINNISVGGSVIAIADEVGGIIGKMYSTGEIKYSSFSGYVEGNSGTDGSGSIGGLIGYSRGYIHHCSANANVIDLNSEGDTDSFIGGLVGANIRSSGDGVEKGGFVTNSSFSGIVTGQNLAGGLIGYNREATVQKSSFLGTVNGYNSVGGLIGSNHEGLVFNSYASGIISSSSLDGGFVGGLIGQAYIGGRIENCFSNGTVNGSLYDTGGLIGSLGVGSTVLNSYSTSDVNGVDYVGGLVGNDTESPIINSYSTGEVVGTGTTGIGGFIGSLSYLTGESVSDYLINDGWFSSAGPSSAIGILFDDFGQLISEDPNDLHITYEEADTTVFYDKDHLVYAQAESDPWDFTTPIWSERANNYPNFVIDPDEIPVGGIGTEDHPYEISDCTELQNIGATNTDGIAPYMNDYFILMNDIDCSATSTWNEDPLNPGIYFGFKPIYHYDEINDIYYNFTGSLDGQDFTISNLYINRPTEYDTGLFGYSYDSSIFDLNLTNVNITGIYAGGIASYLENSVIYNLSIGGSLNSVDEYGSVGGIAGGIYFDSYFRPTFTIDNCHFSGSIFSAAGSAGGLFGSATLDSGSTDTINITIDNSSSSGIVSSNGEYSQSVGGLIGSNENINISNSFSSANVNGIYSSIGGLVGDNESGDFNNTYSTGTVTSDGFYIGGLIGSNINGRVLKSYSTSQVSGGDSVGGLIGNNEAGHIENTYATGNVEGSGDFGAVGGLVGSNTFFSSGGGPNTIVNSYATGNITGTNYVGGLVGYNVRDNIINSYSIGEVIGTGSTGIGGFVGGIIYDSSFEGESADTFLSNNGWYKPVSGVENAVGEVIDYNNETSEEIFYGPDSITYEETDSSVFYNKNHLIYDQDGDNPWDFTTPVWYEWTSDFPKFEGPETNPSETFHYGDVAINEISPLGTNEWVELLNTTTSAIDLAGWTINVGAYTYTIPSGSRLPDRGLLTINLPSGTDKLSDSSATVTLKSPLLTTIDTNTYGSVDIPIPSSEDETVGRDTDGADSWSASSNKNKGWFNAISPTTIANQLVSIGITTNFANLPDQSRAQGLSFEKPNLGKIEFASTLNLTDYTVATWLSTLGSKLDLSTPNKIALDADTVQSLIDTQATLTMYNVNLSNPKILVDGVDDSGNVVSNIVYDRTAKTLTFNVSHFTSFIAIENSSNNNSSNGSSSSSSSISYYSCNDSKPYGVPDLFQINVNSKEAKVYYTPLKNNDDYYISYSEKPLNFEHGTHTFQVQSNGVMSFVVNRLKPNTTYYFRVRGQHGCMPGDWSNEMKITTSRRNIINFTSFYRYGPIKRAATKLLNKAVSSLKSAVLGDSTTNELVSPISTSVPRVTPIIKEKNIPIPTPQIYNPTKSSSNKKHCLLWWCW